MEWKYVKTIAIEAGIQNTGIAFMIIMYSFPQPYATQAIIVPMVVAFLTTKPFWLILIIRNQIRKYKKQKAEKNANLDGKLVISIDKPIENNHVAEKMQQL
jgi:predicted Na+-dependent transporter